MSRGVVLVLIGVSLIGAGVGAEESSPTSQPFRYQAGGRRDPFVALVRDGRLTGAAAQSARKGGQPVLAGIVWDPAGQSLALINDEELKVGDRVDGYQVTEIQPDAVVLSDGSQPLVLRISFDQPPVTKKRKAKGGEDS